MESFSMYHFCLEGLCAAIVDRIQPLSLNICSEGKMWHEHRVTVEKVLKRNKIVFDSAPEIISEYVHNKITEAPEKQYFYNENKDGILKHNSVHV